MKYQKKIINICLFALSVFVSSCANIMNDKDQPMSVETPGCPGATCRLTNSDGTYFINKTPGTVIINKAYGDLTVECEKDGKKATSSASSSANLSMYGNILAGGIIGAAIDGGSGAGFDYPTNIINPLKCD